MYVFMQCVTTYCTQVTIQRDPDTEPDAFPSFYRPAAQL